METEASDLDLTLLRVGDWSYAVLNPPVRVQPSNDPDMGITMRRKRPKRLVQPNRRHIGPDWVQ
jgi:hypothetical protein